MDEIVQIYNELRDKMIYSANFNKLTDLRDWVLNDSQELRSIPESNKQIDIDIVNLTNKRPSFGWVDFDGNINPPPWHGSKSLGSIYNLWCHTNYCYRLYLDNNDGTDKEHIDFIVPNDFSRKCYVGDKEKLNNLIDNYNWLSNPHLTLKHLIELQNLLNHDSTSSTSSNLEPFLFNCISYDNLPQDAIKYFFDSFNENEKFIDPFYNPLSKLSPDEFKASRVSEFIASSDKVYSASKPNAPGFSFVLNNDTNTEFYVYWIDFDGNPKKCATLAKNSNFSSLSGYNNVWALSDRHKTHFFELGKAPFLKDKCVINVSQIHDIKDIDIETYKGVPLESIIIDKNDFEKYNARQGSIGNCWFLQIICSIYARYPEVIASKFINPELMNKTGIVAVKLWSKALNSWRLVIMDDYLPAYSNSSLTWFGAKPSGPNCNRFWVPFLEKAFAKQLGSHKHLEAGVSNIGLFVEYEMIMGPLYKGQDYILVPEIDENFEIFNKMVDYYRNGAVISFSSRNSKTGEIVDKNTHIVSYHGYGLLKIVENVHGFTFVHAHNVWSQGGEWAGDWGDSSPIWDRYPDVKRDLDFENKDDGSFWIEKKDFSRAFSVLWVAKVQ